MCIVTLEERFTSPELVKRIAKEVIAERGRSFAKIESLTLCFPHHH